MRIIKYSAFLALLSLLVYSCSNSSRKKVEERAAPDLVKENINFSLVDSLQSGSYLVYDKNIEGKRPAILIIPEWWGLNDYAKRRADELAVLGYLAMAVDIYGNGQKADNPKDALAFAMPFYQNPMMAKMRFDAALKAIKSSPQADTNNVAAIGYCFGGALVLNVSRMGENLKGAICFHGGLLGTPFNKDLLRAKVLVLNGEDDKFVSPQEVSSFKRQMDSIGANYTFKSYPGATHAFTNPDATASGKKFNLPIAYNAAADTASFNEMKLFLGEIFK